MVARRGRWVELRDSKIQFDAEDDVRFVFTADQFDAFLDGFRGDHRTGLCMELVVTDDGVHMLRSTVPQRQGTTMRFSDTELLAFYDGIQNGEFRQEAFQH